MTGVIDKQYVVSWLKAGLFLNDYEMTLVRKKLDVVPVRLNLFRVKVKLL